MIEAIKRRLNENEGQFHKDKIALDDDVKWLLQELEKLQRVISDHGPEGRNYTNAQYVALRQKNERYEEALEVALPIVEHQSPTRLEIIKDIINAK